MNNSAVIKTSRRLKVGFISSDFGYHTMVTLIRGFLEYIDTKNIEVFCFSKSKSNDVNWFTANITLAGRWALFYDY
jgi:predicted O-linked N-acetylglucosamine transferase (SPINDLY family)